VALPAITPSAMDLPDQPEHPDAPAQHRIVSAAAANPIRLLLVDDKVIMREGVRALLEQEPGLHVVAQASSITEATALDVRPDVVVTDLTLPDARGNDVIDSLRRRFTHAAIFVLIDPDHIDAVDIIGASSGGGVRGYALKTASATEFVSGLRTVAQGVQYLQPSLRAGAARAKGVQSDDRPADPRTSPGRRQEDRLRSQTLDTLTEKEREVLRFLVLGHTNAEIATLSSVSLRTVEARRARVLQKLGVRTRADLVRVAQHPG
jgi:two-component system response regulator NreC